MGKTMTEELVALAAKGLGRAQRDAIGWFARGNDISVSLIRGIRQQREAPRRSVQQSLVSRGILKLSVWNGGWDVSLTELGRAVAQWDENPKGGDGTAPSRSDDSPVGEADAP